LDVRGEDNTYKFALIVGLTILANLGDDYICIVIGDTCRGLEEDERKGWWGSACFLD
jgi:hypothetical protein